MQAIPAPDFPSGGTIVGRAGIFRAYREGPRRLHAARQGVVRGIEEGRSRLDRHHRDSLSGEQGDAGRRHRRTRPRQEDRRHFGSARRVQPRRHAHRRRAQARRAAGRRPEQSLQAHEAADELRHHAAGDRGRASARAEPARDGRAVHRLPARRRSPPDRVRTAQGRSARAHPRGPQDRARSSRRGHHADPRLEESGRSQGRASSPTSASRRFRRRPFSTCSSSG